MTVLVSLVWIIHRVVSQVRNIPGIRNRHPRMFDSRHSLTWAGLPRNTRTILTGVFRQTHPDILYGSGHQPMTGRLSFPDCTASSYPWYGILLAVFITMVCCVEYSIRGWTAMDCTCRSPRRLPNSRDRLSGRIRRTRSNIWHSTACRIFRRNRCICNMWICRNPRCRGAARWVQFLPRSRCMTPWNAWRYMV